ncbi:unnamed protein product [Oppiella nova]|uniref:Adenine phosphoribosyltransferase n=1 Tax=Oppiella nova TaxID=334625 RepID=A0A7R9QCY1_9ACAR|nr:unnamed protein product [Oppiella nova]CAG2162486.1 unnamed protein product [Oppiella nova]
MSGESSSRVSATVVTTSKTDNKRVEKTFAMDAMGVGGDGASEGGISHLSSLKKCVNRLETSLNQYLTQIIDDETEPNPEAVSAQIAGEVVPQMTASPQMTSQPKHKTVPKTALNDHYDYEDSRRPSDGPKHKKCKNNCDNRLERIKETVKSYPDFPKKGILFRDLFPVLREPKVFTELIDLMAERIAAIEPKAEAIIGLESRGFLLGTPLALRLKLPFIPVRKPGKLAGHVRKVSYSLEYGTDSLEIQTQSVTNGLKCVIVDDLIATGGSLKASIDLVLSTPPVHQVSNQQYLNQRDLPSNKRPLLLGNDTPSLRKEEEVGEELGELKQPPELQIELEIARI